MLEKILEYISELNLILDYTGIIILFTLARQKDRTLQGVISSLILGLSNKLTGGNLVTIFVTFITTLFSSKKSEINSNKENNVKGE